MVDNPKTFLILTVAFLISLSVIFFVVNSYQAQKEDASTLKVEVATSTPSNTNETSAKTTSTAKKPSGTTSSTKTNNSGSITPQSKADFTINYTSKGFTPQTLIIKLGQSVRFYNSSYSAMRVTASDSPNQSSVAEFSQGKTSAHGEYYDFTFTRKGTFVYYNLNDKTKTGVIMVQ